MRELVLTVAEVISNLNTRLNAIRTLESRISLIKSYIASVSEPTKNETSPALSHSILRNTNALLAHLSILSPDHQSTFAREVLSQSNDVMLVSMLAQLGENVKSMRELGRKTAVIQSARQTNAARKNPSMAQNRYEEELFTRQGMLPPGGDEAGMYS